MFWIARTEAEEEECRLATEGQDPESVKDYTYARPGDHLMTVFECDTCVFRKLFRRDPIYGKASDDLALVVIRRVLLDAFWSRSKSTVESNSRKVAEGIKWSNRMGLPGIYEPGSALPYHDHCGYEVAMQMVMSSVGVGKYSSRYKQWDTIRKLRSAYSNYVRSSSAANQPMLAIADDQGKSYQRLCSDPCGSLWFARFATGCKRRMGQDWRPNRAVSSDLMKAVDNYAWDRHLRAIPIEEQEAWVQVGAFLVVAYVLSLRGNEALLLDLGALRRENNNTNDHLVIPLKGQVKGEHRTREHLLPCVPVTNSGINVKRWITRMIALAEDSGRMHGSALVDGRGIVRTTAFMNDRFHQILSDVWIQEPRLFGKDLTTVEEIHDQFHVFRSLRRGSVSRAAEMGVSTADQTVVNRWHQKEASGTRRPNRAMDQHYADASVMIRPFLRYTVQM